MLLQEVETAKMALVQSRKLEKILQDQVLAEQAKAEVWWPTHSSV